jgi:hypothetical protein
MVMRKLLRVLTWDVIYIYMDMYMANPQDSSNYKARRDKVYEKSKLYKGQDQLGHIILLLLRPSKCFECVLGYKLRELN